MELLKYHKDVVLSHPNNILGCYSDIRNFPSRLRNRINRVKTVLTAALINLKLKLVNYSELQTKV